MKKFLILLACLPLVGCGTDSVTFHAQDFGGITNDVTKAAVTVKQAQAIAKATYDNGAAPKSPAILQLQTALTSTQDNLTQALIDVATAKTDDQKQTDLANKVAAERDELKRDADSKQKHWTYFGILLFLAGGGLAAAAPAIASMTGILGLIQKIPFIGSALGAVEAVAVVVAALPIVIGLIFLGRLVHFL